MEMFLLLQCYSASTSVMYFDPCAVPVISSAAEFVLFIQQAFGIWGLWTSVVARIEFLILIGCLDKVALSAVQVIKMVKNRGKKGYRSIMLQPFSCWCEVRTLLCLSSARLPNKWVICGHSSFWGCSWFWLCCHSFLYLTQFIPSLLSAFVTMEMGK